MLSRKSLLPLVVALLLALALPITASAADPDWDIPNGHFYTQASGEPGFGRGFAITDDGGLPFWSEFQRLGGVKALGYPASNRFNWDGFAVQATQRVVLQKFPEVRNVSFVNVFDVLHDLGYDDYLFTVRQIPNPADWSSDNGKSWDAIVASHLAMMDGYPAIRAKYYEVPGDPIQMNGLPMARVADMGNVYVLRCQRVVFQQWKEDVPWAKKGDVTVALGGDIAKELKIFTTAAVTPVSAPAPAPTAR